MEITDLVEKNSTLLRLGLHLEFNDARHRIEAHLRRNIDRSEYRNQLHLKLLTFFGFNLRDFWENILIKKIMRSKENSQRKVI